MSDQQASFTMEQVMKSGTNTTFEPILVTEVELSNPIEDIHTDKDQGCYKHVQSLVRIHTIPIGIVQTDTDDCLVTAQTLTKVIWENLSTAINEHLCDNGLPEIDHLSVKGIQSTEKPLVLQRREALLADAPSISVAICTRDHPVSFKRSLDSILALEYPNYEPSGAHYSSPPYRLRLVIQNRLIPVFLN